MSTPPSPVRTNARASLSASASAPPIPGTTPSSSCFRSLVVYNPTLSLGKEERAMDNILFFYPPTAHPNHQMNHIGLCIAVMCVVERFQSDRRRKSGNVLSADEIRTDHRCITVFSPLKDVYMALEADELYDAAICMPLLQKAFGAFVMRYGLDALVDGRSDKAQVVIQSFFTNYSRFLELTVMNVNVDPSSNVSVPSHVAAGGGAAVVPTSASGPSGGATIVDPAPVSQRWQREALSESLLHSPLRLHCGTTYQFQTCSSIVSQYLSLITAQVPQNDNSSFRRRWYPDNSSDDSDEAPPMESNPASTSSPPAAEAKDQRLQQSVLNLSLPHPGSRPSSVSRRIASPSSPAIIAPSGGGAGGETTPQAPSPQNQLLAASLPRSIWSGVQCLLLRRDDRRMLFSTCGDYVSIHLAYLSMIEPNLSSFLVHDDCVPACSAPDGATNGRLRRQPRYCGVHAVDDVMVFLIVEDALHEQLFASIEVVATQLARELSEWMRTGTCTILRDTTLSQTFSSASPPRRPPPQQVPRGSGAANEFLPPVGQSVAPTTSSALAALKDGSSWVCWNNHMVHGAMFAHYPRLVQWSLGSLMREAIVASQNHREENERQLVRTAMQSRAAPGTEKTQGVGRIGSTELDVSAVTVEADRLKFLERSLRYRVERGFVETWLPLGADGWLFVCQRHGRIVGIPFYGNAGAGIGYLMECFSMAERTVDRLFHAAHVL